MRKVFFIVFVLVVALVHSQTTPKKFNYQAVARNVAGATINNQLISVKVDIVDSNQTTILYSEIHNITTSSLGLFSLQIGGGFTISGTFSTIDWGARERYIRTSADFTGGTNYQLLGMSQLLSVPYALYAEKTKLVAGTGINITNGNTISVNYVAGSGISISGNTISSTGGSGQWTNVANGITYQNSSGGIGVGGNIQPNTALTVTQTPTGGYSGAALFTGADTWQTVIGIANTSSGGGYQFNLAGSSNSVMAAKSFSLYNAMHNNFVWNTDGTSNSFLAVGSYGGYTSIPKSRLHIFNGDVNIDQIGSGIIMKSPNGQCWRVTVNNSGGLVTSSIICPN